VAHLNHSNTCVYAAPARSGLLAKRSLTTRHLLHCIRNKYTHTHFLIVYAHRYIASGGDDGAAILWDIRTGKQIAALQSATASSTTAADSTIDAVAFSADSTAVAIGSRDCTVKVCTLQQAEIATYYRISPSTCLHGGHQRTVAYCVLRLLLHLVVRHVTVESCARLAASLVQSCAVHVYKTMVCVPNVANSCNCIMPHRHRSGTWQ
jgi:WD40 repeat protein